MSRRKAEVIKKERPAKRQKKEEEETNNKQWVLLVNERKNGRQIGEIVDRLHGRGGDTSIIFGGECHRRMKQAEESKDHVLYVVMLSVEDEEQTAVYSTDHDACPCVKCTSSSKKKLEDLLADKNKDFWAAPLKRNDDGSIDWNSKRQCAKCGSDQIFSKYRHPGSPGCCHDCKIERQSCAGCAIVYGPRKGEFENDGVCPACGLSKSY
jgi:hypothetical protein